MHFYRDIVRAGTEKPVAVDRVEQPHVDGEDHSCGAVRVVNDGLGSIRVEFSDLHLLHVEVGAVELFRPVNTDITDVESSALSKANGCE